MGLYILFPCHLEIEYFFWHMLPVLFSLKGKGGQLCMLFSNILCLDIRLIYGKLCWSVCHKIHNSSVNADGSGRWKGLWNHDDIYFILKHKPKYKKNSFISFEFLNMCNNQRISCIMYIVFELYTKKEKKSFFVHLFLVDTML